MKYARATALIFCAWLTRRLHAPTRWVENIEDQASMRIYECYREFEPVEVIRASGYACEHMTITAGGGTVRDPRCGYRPDCEMKPYFATRGAA
jgi:hypothetical protein